MKTRGDEQKQEIETFLHKTTTTTKNSSLPRIKFRSVSNLLPCSQASKMSRSGENTSFSEDVLFESKCNYTNLDETLLSSTKNKSLKDYDRELKLLKEENFSLKLRIYMLEEEKSEREETTSSKGGTTNENAPRTTEMIDLESLSSSSTTISSPSSARTSRDHEEPTREQETGSRRRRHRKKHHESSKEDFYATDSEQKEIELENLNRINLDLEKTIETLRADLNKKIQLIEANKKEKEHLELRFEQFRIECEHELHDKFKEQFEAELNEKLDQVSQQAYLRERELTAKLAECEIKLRELIDLVEAKNHEIEILKHERIQFVKEYKETAVKQIDSLMENLIAKENMIQLKDALIEEVEEEEEEEKKKAANNDDNNRTPITSTTTTTTTSTIDQLLRRTTTTSKDSSELLLITNSTSIKQQQKQKSTTSPSTSTETTPKQQHHYQFLISDLENQLRLKESLLQKYILIVRDKDAQINQLINLGLLCNKDLVNAQKLELFIAGLRSNLNDKDHLFEKSLKEHIELVRQKDELIIQSRASNVQLTADLNKANEILLESENRIEQLQSELLSSEEKRRNMESRLSEEIRKNEEIMADYRVELGEKDELVTKLRESLDDMKQRLKRKSDNADLVAFYEEQFHEKDNMIIEMTLKIDKLTNSLAEKINLKEEQINKLKKDGDDRLNAILKENNQLKSELSRVNLELEKLESRFSMQVDEYEIEIENITNKLKEKENTVKSLIQSAEEKDSLIVKLKQLVAQKEEETTKGGEMDTQTSTNKTRSVKIEGLLKLVQEKNQQIDELKIELNELRARTVAASSSMSINDLASSASLLSLSNAASTLPQPQQQPPNVKSLVDALEKEILIYKRLNSLSSAAQHRNELKETLNEVETLRSELLKAASITVPETMKKQQQHQVYQYQPPVQTYGGVKPKQLGSASSDNLVASKSVPTTPSKTIVRPNFVTTQSPTSADLASSPSSTSTSSSQWMALGPPPLTSNNQQTTDSGMDSARSDRAAIVRPATRASSIPRPTNYTSPSPSSSRSSPLNVVSHTGPQTNRSTSATNMQPQQLAMSASTSTLTSDELNYSGYSREELVQLVRQLASENVIIKRQIGTKAPKLTELHNEVSSVRERLAEAVKINDYLRKQIEIYHITHNNTESLLEMAQRLNLTKDELELYKEKLAKIEDLNESLLANSASNNTPRRSSNLDLVAATTNQVTASPNTAVYAPSPTTSFRAKSGFGFAPDPNTIALENEIRLWKSKHQNLKEALDRSNKVSKYLSTLFAKYSPLLKELGILNKTSNLRRCLSEPRLATQQPSVSSHELSGELKRLSSQKLSSARFDVLLSRQVSESGGRRSLEAEIDIMRPYADSSSTTLTMSEIFQAQRVQIRCDQLERQLKDRDALANDYYLRLFNIYNAFKNLKANPKYLKQMFSEPLIDSFRERLKMHRVEDNIQSEDNLIHSIFSGAFVKFDELNKIIEEKEALINNLRCEMEKLKDLKVPKSPIDTSDDANSNFESTHNNMNRKDELAQAKMREYLSRTKTNLEDVMGQLKQMNLGENKSKEFARWLESTANDLKSLDELISSSFAHSPLHFNFNLPLTDQSDSSRLFNNENNSELKTKLKKYREEIVRLKDKIKSQNKEVEEALNQLMTTNREKENTKILLSTIQNPEIDSPRSTTSTNRLKLNPNLMNSEVNNDNLLSEKLSKTHSKLKKARDNIQTRLGEQEIFGKESESATN